MINSSTILFRINQLIKRYGIKSLTMDDISREMGISKKTLYEFVSNKTELINLALNHDFLETKKQLLKIDQKPENAILKYISLNEFFLEFIKGFRTTVDYDLKKYYPEIYNSIKEDYYTLFTKILLDLIKQGKNEGVFRNDIDENIITRLLISRLEILPNTGLFTIDEYTTREFNREVLAFNLRGIVSEKSKQIIEQYLNKV